MATLPNNPNGPIYGTNGDDSGSKALVGTFEYSDTIYGGDGKDEVHGRFGADYLGRICKLGLGGGKTGLSPVRHTMRLAEDRQISSESWTRAGPSHRSGSLQTRPSTTLAG